MNAATRSKLTRELAGLKALLKGKLTATERKTIEGLVKKFRQALKAAPVPKKATLKSKPKAKPTPPPEPVKAKRPRVRMVRCDVLTCAKFTREDELLPVRVGFHDEYRCRSCAKMFYVMACEPGREKHVKKALLDNFRRQPDPSLFGRVVVPLHKEVKTFRTVYEVLDDKGVKLGVVRAEDADEAMHLAKKETYPARTGKSREKDGAFVKRDARGELLDVPIIREVNPVRNEQYAVRKESSYPGYVIVQMLYSEDTSRALERVSGAWGLLPPRPRDTVVKIDPKTKKPRNVKLNEEQMMRIKDDRDRDLLYDIETWRPTAIATEEAANILIREKSMNAKSATKSLTYNPGDVVRIKEGTFAKQEGVVVTVSGPEDNPTVRVKCRIMGVLFDLDLHHTKIVRTGTSETKPTV